MSDEAVETSTETAPAETPEPVETAPRPEPTDPTADVPHTPHESPTPEEETSAEGQPEAKEATPEGEEVEKPEKPPKPPKKFKIKVDGAEREFTEEEVHDRVNKAELHQKWELKIREAGEQVKEAQKIKGSAERIVSNLRQRGPALLEDLLTADFGDPDRAQDEVLAMFEKWSLPIYQEREKPPEERRAARAEREAARYKERLERTERERREAEQKAAQERTTSEKQKADLDFEKKIASEMESLKVVNDRVSEWIYRDAKKIADETNVQLTPKHYAVMIQAERKRLGLDKPEVALAPAAPTNGAEKTPDEVRLENLAKAREKLAQTRKPDKVSTTPGFPKAKRPLSTDDVREKLGID